jgi:antitoxin (DNA-binding transcriptional repressor) of toxin-antitoxin stability system
MTTVSVRELKSKLGSYLKRAEDGEQIVVTSRGKPVATLSRPPKPEMTAEERWKDMEARGEIRLGKGKYIPPERLIPLQGEGPSVSEMVLEDRGERIP